MEARNAAENAVYLAEKSLREAGDKIAPDLKSAVGEKIEKAKAAIGGSQTAEEIKSAAEELSLELQKIGAAMYNKNQNPESEQTPPEN